MVEIVEASLKFSRRNVVVTGTVEGGNVLTEGKLKWIGHYCFVVLIVVVLDFCCTFMRALGAEALLLA